MITVNFNPHKQGNTEIGYAYFPSSGGTINVVMTFSGGAFYGSTQIFPETSGIDYTSATSGTTGHIFYITATANTTTVQKECFFTINLRDTLTGNVYTYKVEILQEASSEEPVTSKIEYTSRSPQFSGTTITLPSAAEYNQQAEVWLTYAQNPTVTSNVPWATPYLIQTEDYWLLLTDVTTNTGATRSGSLVVSAEKTNGQGSGTGQMITSTISVNQTGDNYTFTCTPEREKITKSTQNLRINISSSNVRYIICDAMPLWALDTEITSTYGDFEILANEGGSRTGTFVFQGETNGGQTVTCQCTVVQEGNSSIYFYGGQIYGYSAQSGTTAFESTTAFTGCTCTSLTSGLTIDSCPTSGVSGVTYYVRYHIPQNTTDDTKNYQMTITANGGNLSDSTTIYQTEKPSFYEFPLWKDFFVGFSSATTSDYLNYKITDDMYNTLYAGRVFIDRTKDWTEVRMNGILSNYVYTDFNILQNGLQDIGGWANFKMYIVDDSDTNENLYCEMKTYDDYSYEYHSKAIISAPVTRTLDKRQKFIISVNDIYLNGTGNQLGVYLDGVPQFYNWDNSKKVLIINDISNVNKIKCTTANGEEMEYSLSIRCNKDYCLYYRNLYGGYDSLLFDGKEIEKNSATISTYNKEYDNRTLERGTVQYNKSITRKWELTTGYLTDAQSKRMVNVYSSPEAYLHNLTTGEIVPVNVTDNGWDVKTFRNNGRKPYLYTIKVESAQGRFIK